MNTKYHYASEFIIGIGKLEEALKRLQPAIVLSGLVDTLISTDHSV
jgi:hypothetical protein